MAIGDVVIGGIDVIETHDSYGVEVGVNARARRTLECAWADRVALQSALCGEVVGGVFEPPLPYPDYEYLLCTEAPITQGIGPSGYTANAPTYDRGRIDALYSAVPWLAAKPIGSGSGASLYQGWYTSGGSTPKFGTTVYYSLEIGLSTEFISVGNGLITWGAGMGGGAVQQPIGVNVGIHDILITRWYIPDADFQNLMVTLQGVLGRTNDAAWLDWPKRSLKFEGMTTFPHFTPAGNRIWDVTYLIRYRQHNWDFYPGTGGAFFDFAVSPYSEADFELLWSS